MPSKPPTVKHQTHAWTLHSISEREREPLCRMCKAAGRLTEAVCIDHKIPIAEGGSLHDPENLQPLCAACHRKKTAIEGRARALERGKWPTEGVVVLGAPGAGKSTLVAQNAGANELVWDADRVLAALRGREWRNDPRQDAQAVAMMGRLRRALIEAWRDGWCCSRVWWITTSIDEAREIMEGMPAVRLIVIDAPLDDLAQRIERRSWLTDEQRADVLALARNMTATLAVTAFAYGDRASRVQTSCVVAGGMGL